MGFFEAEPAALSRLSDSFAKNLQIALLSKIEPPSTSSVGTCHRSKGAKPSKD